VFIVENATDGINSVLKSLTWSEGDVIVIPNTAYNEGLKKKYLEI
jgi:selenocysteine lyase/cysteine desulfurase